MCQCKVSGGGTLTEQTKGAVVGGAFRLRGNDGALLRPGATKPRLGAGGGSADNELKLLLDDVAVTAFIAGMIYSRFSVALVWLAQFPKTKRRFDCAPPQSSADLLQSP